MRLSCGGPSPHQQPRLGRPCLPRNAMVVSATKFPCFFFVSRNGAVSSRKASTAILSVIMTFTAF